MSSIVSAVGVLFYAQKTQRYFYLLRNDEKHPDCWSLAGGKVEGNETLMSALTRECFEEIGFMPEYQRMVPIEKFTSSDNNFNYHTFFCVVEEEFIPVLNDEHTGYAWINSGIWPKPLHPGLWATINFAAVQEKISTIQQSLIQ